MKRLAALLISVSALTSGCTVYTKPDPDSGQSKPHTPTDLNRNSVPDSLERKAVPAEPVISEPAKSSK